LLFTNETHSLLPTAAVVVVDNKMWGSLNIDYLMRNER